MASQAELSMEYKPYTYSTLLKSFADQTDQTYKLEDFLSRLEEERLKIDAFKRELPLCMQLLTNAVDASRQQLQNFRSNQGTRPILEEFIPIKHPNSQESTEKASNISDKASWMTSAQLWSQASEGTKPKSTITSPKESADTGFSVSPRLALEHRNGGAFLPFSKERNSCQGIGDLPELGLACSESEMEVKKCEETEKCSKRENSGKGGSFEGIVDQGKVAAIATEAQTTNTTTTTTNTTGRKARRCWSPDLHRRFVNALQMLGGSQVATPKQIRELMKVDGLTNDEVKSHLQKYRLHTRRPSPSLHAGAPTPQLVVLGGIWVPPEYATAAAHSDGTSFYSPHPTSHVPPQHYCAATPMSQEFYNSAPSLPLPPPHDHTLHHHFHMYKTAPHTQSSPESDVRSGGDRSESIEDGKSESGSWKGSGEKRGLAALRDQEGEDSTGSEITLRF
ncbi:myb family transcription factor EFM-like [Vigna umbellata]|uniref:myb family transcription factor EFM-like n=1 Tax=Vigna umbellata TaxID=87088 RepID=UPI001F5E4BA1|nr:myb family transcription factor EFM-like [Vigna umbellata]